MAKRLVETAPGRLRRRISHPERGRPSDELRERLRNLHLIHDGMRHAHEVRARTALPRPITPLRPVLSGHGGELAHGFYYVTANQLREIRAGGDRAILKRLERAGRRYASAAQAKAYDLYRSELERILDEARAIGVAGPTLLDCFYLTQRLAFRSGLGARSGRYSCCATPAFVRAAFDLTPEERLENKLHVAMIGRMVPEWREVPFLEREDPDRLPTVHRQRIWEKPGHAEAVGEMLATEDGGWGEIFQPKAVRRMWRRARAGRGHRHYEGVFEQVVMAGRLRKPPAGACPRRARAGRRRVVRAVPEAEARGPRDLRPDGGREDRRWRSRWRTGCGGAAKSLLLSLATRFRSTGGSRRSPGRPRPRERSRLEHRLVGFVDVSGEFSAGQFASLAHAEIDQLLAEGRWPIVVGGTGLYLRAALAGPRPSTARPGLPPRRGRGRDRQPGARRRSTASSIRTSSAAVHPRDRKRVARALELQRAGIAPPQGSEQLWTAQLRRPTALVGLTIDREELGRRIEARVEEMARPGPRRRRAAPSRPAPPAPPGRRSGSRRCSRAIWRQ